MQIRTLPITCKGLLTSVLLVNLVACAAPNSIADTPTPTSANNQTATVPKNSLEQYKISVNGMGPIRIGMTVTEASKAAGVELIGYGSGKPEPGSTCRYVRPKDGPPELDFMLAGDRIVRVDVRKRFFKEVDGRPVEVDIGDKSRITTQEGAKIGDTEARIKALYPNVEVTGHKYVPKGHYLMVKPTDPKLANYRLIFETDGDRVTYIRSGRLPEVEWLERCG